MIVTRKWLQDFIDIKNISDSDLINSLNSIGLEVGNIKKIELDENIIFAKILDFKPHKNSDHLNVCVVDISQNEPLNIVCGASNVKKDAIVPLAMIGATMPSGFKIKKAKLRGVESFGMICSASELGFNKTNDGILLFDDFIDESFIGKKVGEILDDLILEIDLTPNRGDCLSVYGVARDLSAYLNINLKEQTTFSDQEGAVGIARALSIHSKDGFNGIKLSYKLIDLISDIKINFLKLIRLAEANLLSENNLINLINYASHSSGVIIKAYDYNKISNGSEKVGLEVKKEDFGNYGIYFGDEFLSFIGFEQVDKFKISDNTKLAIIELSYIDPEIISKAIYNNKILNKDDITYKSTRGSEPNLILGLNELFCQFKQSGSVKIYAGSQNVDFIGEKKVISFDDKEISKIIGFDIDKNEMVAILKRLCFEVGIEKDLINVKVPFFRHDIKNHQDIAEEIVRIYGIDKIPPKPLSIRENRNLNANFISFEKSQKIRQRAAGSGFYECINYIFDNKDELELFGFEPFKKELLNPINNELNSLRSTLINHLLKASILNSKNYKKSIKLFEIGSVFRDESEKKHIAFLASGLKEDFNIINSAKPKVVDFYYFINLIQSVIGEFECKKVDKYKFLNPFEQAEIIKDDRVIGYVGNIDLRFNKDLLKTYVCEIDFNELRDDQKFAKPYSKFPAISRDLSLVVNKNLEYTKIKDEISSLEIPNLKEFRPIDIYKDESLGDNFSLTINFIFQDLDKTLEDKDIELAMHTITTHLQRVLNINLR